MKKTLIFFLALSATLLLAACGGETTEETYPVISGTYDREVETGGLITDWLIGVEAHDENDGDLTGRIELDTSELDIYTPGTYTVYYRVTNDAGNETVETITVTVTETDEDSPPTLSGLRDLILAVGETDYDYLDGIGASDVQDGDLSDAITVDDSAVDYDEPGEYPVYFHVENSLGLETTESITVTILLIPYQVENGSFETGDLTGWTVVSGNAFSDDAVVSTGTFWDGTPFNHVGDYHFRGLENGESAIGSMHSSPFTIGGVGKISFLMGAAADGEQVFVTIRHLHTNEVLARITNTYFDYIDGDQPYNYAENYRRYYVDLSDYLGEHAYIEVVDEDSDDAFFSFINIDDFVTYYEEDPEVATELENGTFEDLSGWTLSEAYDEEDLLHENDIVYFETPGDQPFHAESHAFRLGGNLRLSLILEGSDATVFEVLNADDHTVIASVRGDAFGAFKRHVFDLSLHEGTMVYLRISDNDEHGSIRVADIRLTETLDGLSHMPSQIANGSFETGDLTGWTVRTGGAFTDGAVTDASLFWEDIAGETGRFNHVGTYHFHGALASETEIGAMRSSYFRVGGEEVISLLLGAGRDASEVFVQLKDGNTNQVLKTITNTAFDFSGFGEPYDYANNYHRFYLDVSAFSGRVVYLDVIDLARGADNFSFINIDDVITYYDTNIIIPESLEFQATSLAIEWANYVHIFNVDSVSFDDSAVDTTVGGSHTLTITINHHDGSSTTHDVAIHIGDDAPPTITGAEDHLILVGEPVDLLEGVTATDAFGDPVDVFIDEADYDALDFDTPGVYPVRYRAIGPNGLEQVVEVTIEVIDPQNTPENAGFESGDLSGWRIIEGDAFCVAGVTGAPTYWAEDVPFNHVGNYHFRGFVCGEDNTGIMRSDYFILAGTGYVSFLMGGANPLYEDIYVNVVDAMSGEVLATVYNEYMMDESYVRYYLDLGDYTGRVLYFEIIDESERSDDFAAINLDDFITYYPEMPALDITIDDTIDHDLNVPFDPADHVVRGVHLPASALAITYEGTIDTSETGSYPLTIIVEYGGLTYEQAVSVEVSGYPNQLYNGSFETGDLSGWTIIEGDAFCAAAVTDEQIFWGGSFNHVGTYHFRGFNCGEDNTGIMRSDYFMLDGTGYVSFLMGGANPDYEDIYVNVVDGETGAVITTVYNTYMAAEAYVRYYLDLSAHIGSLLYFEIVDESDRSADFAAINLDDFITYYPQMPALDVSFDSIIEHTVDNPFDPAAYMTAGPTIPEQGLVVTYTGTIDTETVGTYPLTLFVEYGGITYEQDFMVEVGYPYQVYNGSFETGDLSGWTIIEGDAFCEAGVTDDRTFWGGSFWQYPLDDENSEDVYGTYHFRGVHCGEGNTGIMHSSYFELGGSGYISLLMGAARDTELIYVSVMAVNPDGEDEEIHRFTNDNFEDPDYSENYNEYVADLSDHIGRTLYLRVVDNDDSSDFAFLNLDHIVTYHATAPGSEE